MIELRYKKNFIFEFTKVSIFWNNITQLYKSSISLKTTFLLTNLKLVMYIYCKTLSFGSVISVGGHTLIV